jgi:hypothetical protein
MSPGIRRIEFQPRSGRDPSASRKSLATINPSAHVASEATIARSAACSPAPDGMARVVDQSAYRMTAASQCSYFVLMKLTAEKVLIAHRQTRMERADEGSFPLGGR